MMDMRHSRTARYSWGVECRPRPRVPQFVITSAVVLLAVTTALGEAFDLRAVHDVVLGHGSLPLPVPRDLVEDRVAESLVG